MSQVQILCPIDEPDAIVGVNDAFGAAYYSFTSAPQPGRAYELSPVYPSERADDPADSVKLRARVLRLVSTPEVVDVLKFGGYDPRRIKKGMVWAEVIAD